MTRAPIVAQVLLDSALPQLDHLFDYRVPADLHDKIAVGQRVKVPLRVGARLSYGYVVALHDHSNFSGELSAVSEIVSDVCMLTPAVYELARVLADRSAGSASDILRLCIPARQVRVEKSYLGNRPADALGSRLGALQVPPGVSDNMPSRSALTPANSPVRLSSGEWVSGWALELAQRAARLYVSGRSAIVSVPDRHDLDQFTDALVQCLAPDEDNAVVRVDAQQSNGERYRNFLRALEASPVIVVGNRSAVYAPAFNLGAIFVWDDADAAFNEPLSPYVHTRDAALVRAEREHIELVFAAHTQSAEVRRLVNLGYLREERIDAPRRKIVLSASMSHTDERARLPAAAIQTMRQGLKNGPVLVQVATPGQAAALFCANCDSRQRCPDCAGPLQPFARDQHDATGSPLECRWCHRRFSAHSCPSCGHTKFRVSGIGASRTAAQFEALFPTIPVRVSDGTNRLTLVDSRPAIVVATRGTEPVAATGYSAVLLLDGERMLAAESLHAEEEVLRFWSNAVALSRSDAHVLLTDVSGALAKAFALGATTQWMDSLLSERKRLGYPPAVRVATVAGPDGAVEAAIRDVAELALVDRDHSAPSSTSDSVAILRFAYGSGAEVAARLRAALIRDATSRHTRAKQTVRGIPARLKLHFDDPNAFDERHRTRGSMRRSSTPEAPATDFSE